MNQQSQFVFRRRNAVFLGICLGGLTLLILVSILPLMAQHHALDQESTALKDELANQQQHKAGIDMVDAILAKIDQQPTPQVASLIPLSQDDSDLIIQDIKALASETSFVVATIEPLLDKKNSWQSLTVQVELQGLFPNLRSFLLKLLALPYVKQIERIEIHPGSHAGLSFRLTYTIVLA